MCMLCDNINSLLCVSLWLRSEITNVVSKLTSLQLLNLNIRDHCTDWCYPKSGDRYVFLLFLTGTALCVNQERTVRCPSEARLLRSSVCGPLPPYSLTATRGPTPPKPPSRSLPPTRAQRGHNDQVTLVKLSHCQCQCQWSWQFSKISFVLVSNQAQTVWLLPLVVPKDNIFHIFFSIHIHFCSPVHCCSPVAVELDLPLWTPLTLSLQNNHLGILLTKKPAFYKQEFWSASLHNPPSTPHSPTPHQVPSQSPPPSSRRLVQPLLQLDCHHTPLGQY